MEEAKRTPLYEVHKKYGGKVIDFAGWLLPVQYSGILEEHKAVRERAGLFDVSHMGEISITGQGALNLVQKLVTNDASTLKIGQIQYAPMCYQNGGVVDDLLVYKKDENEYLLVVNAANIAKDWEWIKQNSLNMDASIKNLSDATAQLALQGPLALKILTKLTDFSLSELKYYWFESDISLAGKTVLISRTGYTGEDGFEIYCDPKDAVELWDDILEAGKPEHVLPTGLGCRDTLRFEACMPLYGHELSAEITPLEAGLSRFVRLDKAEFNGKEKLAEQKSQGLTRKIVGVEMIGRGIARAGYSVYAGEQKIGMVTTGSFAPTLNKNLALALVDASYASVGNPLFIEIRGKLIEAKIVGKPFYKK